MGRIRFFIRSVVVPGLIAMLAVSGALIAWRGQLDFVEYALMRVHIIAGLVFSVVFLFGFLRILGSEPGMSALKVYYPLLVIFFAVLPLSQYIFFQITYGLAALALIWFAVKKLNPRIDRRTRIGICLSLWLFGLPVFIAGWHLAAIDTLRNNFYHVFHRYGALAAAVTSPFLIGFGFRNSPESGKIGRAIGAAVAAVVLALTWQWGYSLADRFKDQRREVRPAPVFAESEMAKMGVDLLPRDLVATSLSCATSGCHADIYDQWYQSAHHVAPQTKTYQKLLRVLIEEKGPDATMLCTRCHTPYLALSGHPDNPDDPSLAELRNEGISCQICHIVDDVRRPPANGFIRVRFDRDYLGDYNDDPAINAYRAWMIRKNLQHHRAMYARKILYQPEACAACHRVEMPITMPNGRQLILGDVHTPWAQSTSAQKGASCQDCHMPLTIMESHLANDDNPLEKAHARPDHRFAGTNQSLKLLVPEQADALGRYDTEVERRLRGNVEIPKLEYWYLWATGSPKLKAFLHYLKGQDPMRMELARSFDPADNRLTLTVTSYNNTFSHILPSGPLDLNEIWLDVNVADANGNVLYQSPGIGPDGYLSPDAVKLGIEIYDGNGQRILNHRFWETREARNKQVLGPDDSRKDDFNITIPTGAALPLRAKVRWMYRRYTQDMSDFVYGPGQVTFPVTTFAEASTRVDDLR